MTKKIARIVFLLSLSFNVAFLIHLLSVHIIPATSTENHVALQLTHQQKKHIEPIRAEMHRQNETIKAQIASCREKLLAALKAEPVDKTAITKCVDNISNLQKKIQLNTIEEIIHLRNFMDADQCNCLIDSLEAAMTGTAKPCNCPQCRSARQTHNNQ
jgi:hypothetical protein